MDNCLVTIFAVDEPTVLLTEHCFKKLGFKNVLVLQSKSGFKDKFIQLAEIVNDTDYEVFIRSDSDRLVFDGMVDLYKEFLSLDGVDNVEGYGFDYLMDKFRGATPQVYSRRCLMKLYNDRDLIADVPKPENYFGKKSELAFESKKIFTNLHDFAQRPSKICNAFLNRFIRDNPPMKHFDINHIKKLPPRHYAAFEHAVDLYKTTSKKNMNYLDENLSFLDEGYVTELNQDIEKSYNNFKEIYDTILGKYNEHLR